LQRADDDRRRPAPQVAEWAGHAVEMLLRVYATCIDGQDEALRRLIMETLGASYFALKKLRAVRLLTWADSVGAPPVIMVG
jgi:hypothetical protein